MGIAQKKAVPIAKVHTGHADIEKYTGTRHSIKDRVKASGRRIVRKIFSHPAGSHKVKIPGKKRLFKHPWLHKAHIALKHAVKPVVRFLGRITHKATERQVLMIVPHSAQKLMRISIPNYAIFTFALIVLGSLVFSLFFLNSSEADYTEITRLSDISSVRRKQIEAFRLGSAASVTHFSTVWAPLNQLSALFGARHAAPDFPLEGNTEDYLNEKQTREVETPLFLEEEHTLDNLGLNIAAGADQLVSINKFLENMKAVLDKVPSLWPVGGGGIVSSRYGMRSDPFTGAWRMHSGLDIAWWPGSPIRATANGVVKLAGWYGNYGICVIIEHEYGYATLYAHLSVSRVSEGDIVKRGDIVAAMGNTGKSTGHHLHYEVRFEGTPTDPAPYTHKRTLFADE